MGALAPIANLIGFSTGGQLGGGGGQQTTPPLDNFFGITPGFLKAPAGGTALFNNILFGSSNQQVPIDFLANGFYTGVPPIFGGKGFTGLPSRFDLLAGNPGLFGVDAVLNLEKSLTGGARGPAAGVTPAASVGPSASNKGTAAASKTATSGAASVDTLKNMSLGSLMKLLLA